MISWFEKHSNISWIISAIIAGIMFYMSSLEFQKGPPGGFSILPIAYHILAYFFLAVFVNFALIKGKKTKTHRIYITLIITFLYAISDEMHQYFVPGRSLSGYDILLDLSGILLACFLYLVLIKQRKIYNKNL